MKRVFVYALLVCLVLLRPALADGGSSGQTETALSALVSARQADPTSAVAAKQLEDFVSAGLPTHLHTAWIPTLPVEATSLPYDLGTVIVPKAYLPTQATEPIHEWKFSKVAYLYAPGEKERRLFCAVHYQSEDSQPLAIRIARLLALAHQTLTTKTGQEAANGTDPFDVWLCAKGQTGGEQWRSNLYLYDIETPRSSIEWIREIVHEYSHLALPAIGGYTSPEYWANGYLGERLIVRWLMRLPDGSARVEAVWGDFSGAANFDRLLLAPALAQYQKIGPNPAWLARTDEAGMRYLIGQALTFDDKYGGQAGKALSRLPQFHETTAKDFAAALGETLASARATP